MESVVVGGPGVIVEIDESLFGKRKYHKGKRVNGQWVVGGVELTNEKKCFFVLVDSRDANTLFDVVFNHVIPGSIIITDCWRAYLPICQSLNFQHMTVNHSICFKDQITGACTNTIEGIWNGVKLNIKPRNCRGHFLERCLYEYLWRRHHANNLWNSFI